MNATEQNPAADAGQEIDALAALKERLAQALTAREAVQAAAAQHNAQIMAQHRAQREARANAIPVPSLRDLPPEPVDSAQAPENQGNEPVANPSETQLQPDANPSQPDLSSVQPDEPVARRPFTPRHGPLGILNKLSYKDQDRIIALLNNNHGFSQVARALAQPPPDGLNIQVSDVMIRRFWKRHSLRLRLQFQADLADEARSMLGNADATGHDLTEAASRLLRMELLDEAIRADHNLAQLTQLSAILHKHQQTDLAARRLHLAEKKSTEGRTP